MNENEKINIENEQKEEKSEAEIFLESLDRANEILSEMEEKYFFQSKAMKEAAKEIKKLPGVKDAGVAEGDDSIWIEYDNGMIGSVLRREEGVH